MQQYINNENLENIYMADSRILNSNKGTIYVTETSEIKNATAYMNDGTIVYIWSNLTDEQIVRIVDRMH